MFAQRFGNYDNLDYTETRKSERLRSKSSLGKVVEESNSEQFQISYTIDHILTSRDAATHRAEMIKLLNGLSTTQEMSYFRSSFVQRFLLYHWETKTKKQYAIIFSIILLSYLLILTNTILMRYNTNRSITTFFLIRVIIDGVNFLLILPLLLYIQIRMIIKNGRKFFKKASNVNELVYASLFLITTAFDIKFYSELEKDKADLNFESISKDKFFMSMRILNAALIVSGGWRILGYA